jgi:Restriction endonuclease
MSTAERNQLALDRYCNPTRKRTPWAAGIQYERYVGFTYERLGFVVEYQGALEGREDLGIDLVCEDDNQILIVQCKRLAAEKQLPVRENTVAQIFGSAEFHRMCSRTVKTVRPVLITTYQLSEKARDFARHLNVDTKEFFELKPYAMIKCNISRVDGQKSTTYRWINSTTGLSSETVRANSTRRPSRKLNTPAFAEPSDGKAAMSRVPSNNPLTYGLLRRRCQANCCAVLSK